MNKFPFFFSSFLLIFTNNSHAQQQFPGGIAGAKMWYASEKRLDTTAWRNKLAAKNNYSVSDKGVLPITQSLINFNEGLYFNGVNNGLSLHLETEDLSKTTIFTVYQPVAGQSERHIWQYDKGNTNDLVLTTHRLADLSTLKYMNFVDNKKDIPVINTYIQFQEKDSVLPTKQVLTFGNTPLSKNLPIAPFKGIIPEIIVYNRVLTYKERVQVESYLALKYGIGLSQAVPTSYLNAKGTIIWNSENKTNFTNNITGIGRDDASGLYQKQAASAYNPQLFSISVDPITTSNALNKAFIPDNSFLIWSDNDQELDWQQRLQGQPQRLKRQWLMSSYGQTDALKTSIRFNARHIKTPLKKGETYWLSIDQSGTGRFPLNKTVYQKADSLTMDSFIVFNTIQWDADKSGHDLFTIAKGGKMLPLVWLTQPTCTPQYKGALRLKIEGGQAPFTVQLNPTERGINRQLPLTTGQYEEIKDIEQGSYVLTIKDSEGNTHEEMIFVQSTDAPVSALLSEYALKPNQILHLDATVKNNSTLNIHYEWRDEAGLKSSSPTIDITQAGLYQLTIDSAGCKSKLNIGVTQQGDSNFRAVSLFPNPTTDGYFNLKIILNQKASVWLKVYDMAGKMILDKSFSGSDIYFLKEQFTANGVYLVTLTCNGITTTVNLVVN